MTTGFFGPLAALDLHLIAGAAIALLLAFRVFWGLAARGPARFTSFAYGPRAVIVHARGLLDRTARRHLGHNPLGSVMVFALLAVLTLIVGTGTVALGGQDKQGPLAAFTAFRIGYAARNLHFWLAIGLLAMVAAHIGGVLFESRHERENLTAAMLTGCKRLEPGTFAPSPHPPPQRATRLAVVGGLAIAAGLAGLATLPVPGVPTAAPDADYALQCGACHMVYSPSLQPAARWNAILDDLKDHFGADASLDPAITAHLRGYLNANSAEHWDTLPAVLLRDSTIPTLSKRITETAFWQRRHGAIPAATFAGPRVGGRSNCSTCHADAATGLFAPQRIRIPR